MKKLFFSLLIAVFALPGLTFAQDKKNVWPELKKLAMVKKHWVDNLYGSICLRQGFPARSPVSLGNISLYCEGLTGTKL